MDDSFFRDYSKTGAQSCCQKIKCKQDFQSSAHLFPVATLMPFPDRWLWFYTLRKRKKNNFPALMYVEETSNPHKVIFYNHTKFASGVCETFSGQFRPVKRKRGKEGVCFPASFIFCMRWIYLAWSVAPAAAFELFSPRVGPARWAGPSNPPPLII